MIEAGAQAPDFTLPDQDGNEVSLADLRGRRVLLVFYPADFSPACTDQLSVYQEVLGELEDRGRELFGISVDSAYCHKAFQRTRPDDPAAGRLPSEGRGGQGLRRLVGGVRPGGPGARARRPRRDRPVVAPLAAARGAGPELVLEALDG